MDELDEFRRIADKAHAIFHMFGPTLQGLLREIRIDARATAAMSALVVHHDPGMPFDPQDIAERAYAIARAMEHA